MNLSGKLLIAPPIIKEGFWDKTVVFVTEHHDSGSIGLALNKCSALSIREFGNQLDYDLDYPGFVYQGGPVHVKNLSMLHTNDWVCRNTMKVTQHLSISSADDMLPRLAMGDSPYAWRIFLGLCTWGPDQLEEEINGTPPYNKDTSWCIANSDTNLIYDYDTTDQWIAALDRSGSEFAQSMFT
jgi:putative transcriptional regulator